MQSSPGLVLYLSGLRVNQDLDQRRHLFAGSFSFRGQDLRLNLALDEIYAASWFGIPSDSGRMVILDNQTLRVIQT
jgi:hypothetical protein